MAWLHELSEWLLGFSQSGWAVGILALSSFTESIFNPIPPDALLVAVAIHQPHNAIPLALMVTAASVAGALVGHWLGARVGRPIVDRLLAARHVERAERLFDRYGVWAVLFAALTPVPYKVFAILAGVLEFDRRPFLVASLIGRGLRFVLIGVLIMIFGERIEAFITDHLEIATWSVGGAVLGAVAAAAAYRLYRLRRPPTKAQSTENPPV